MKPAGCRFPDNAAAKYVGGKGISFISFHLHQEWEQAWIFHCVVHVLGSVQRVVPALCEGTLCKKKKHFPYFDSKSKASISWTDHSSSTVDPNPPFRLVEQDLYSIGPTHAMCARSHRWYSSHPATWARSQIIHIKDPSALKDLDHELCMICRYRWSYGVWKVRNISAPKVGMIYLISSRCETFHNPNPLLVISREGGGYRPPHL